MTTVHSLQKHYIGYCPVSEVYFTYTMFQEYSQLPKYHVYQIHLTKWTCPTWYFCKSRLITNIYLYNKQAYAGWLIGNHLLLRDLGPYGTLFTNVYIVITVAMVISLRDFITYYIIFMAMSSFIHGLLSTYTVQCCSVTITSIQDNI